MSDRATFGAVLRRYRRHRGVTQETLAELAGVSVRAISDLERGARTYPYRDTASRLADALELSGQARAEFLAAARRPPATAMPQAFAPTRPSPIAPLTHLIGRDAERQRVRHLLRDGVRVLTLTGPAGVGKTSLSLAAVGDLDPAFRDGIVFIDLAPLVEPAQVIPAIAAALNLADHGDIPPAEAIRRRLQERRMLLVLDSFEHLLPAAPALSDILQGAPGVQALVTSRAPLRLRWEREVAVGPLPVPDLADGLAHDEVGAWPAVALFVERAQAVDAAFQLTVHNASAVVDICRQLDGLPLAIELAAARTRLLSPGALLGRLEDRLSLLTTGPQDAPPRQRSLRAAIAWSYDLLPPAQQTLLRQLAVFVGGWTLEAAEFVGAAHGVPQTVDALDALVAHSLVVRDDEGAGSRFRLLETIREFAVAQLTLAGGVIAARETFLRCLVQCARENDLGRLDAGVGLRLDRLKAEMPNLLAGLEWAIDHDPALALDLLAELDWFWFHADQPMTGRLLCERALAASEDEHTPARLRVIAQVAWLSSLAGDFAALATQLAALRALAVTHGDARLLAYARMYDGDLAMSRGDTASSAVCLDDALARFQEVQDLWGLIVCLNTLGVVAQERGDPAAAVACFERIQAIMIERQLPAHFHAHTLVNLATVYRQLGRVAEAFATAQEALRLAREARRASVAAAAQGEMARYNLDQGDLSQAAPLARDSLTTFWEIGSMWDLTPTLELAAMVLVAAGQPELAARLLAAASSLREAMPYPIGASDQPALASALAAIQAALGEAAFAHAWNTGRSRPLDASVREALAGLAVRAGA